MSSEQFTYWLQGFAEINTQPPTAEQWEIIKDHLTLVFTKATPFRNDESFKPNPFVSAPLPAQTFFPRPPAILC